MENKKVTKSDLHIEYLTEQYCEYISELFNQEKRKISDDEIEEFQAQITDLVKDFGKKVSLVVVGKIRKGPMRKELGKDYNRKARFVEDVLKNRIKIPSDATNFELSLRPAILVRNKQKGKIEAKVLNQDLNKVTVYMGEATDNRQHVNTSKSEYHMMSENYNECVWADFDTRLVSVKENEITV